MNKLSHTVLYITIPICCILLYCIILYCNVLYCIAFLSVILSLFSHHPYDVLDGVFPDFGQLPVVDAEVVDDGGPEGGHPVPDDHRLQRQSGQHQGEAPHKVLHTTVTVTCAVSTIVCNVSPVRIRATPRPSTQKTTRTCTKQ